MGMTFDIYVMKNSIHDSVYILHKYMIEYVDMYLQF